MLIKNKLTKTLIGEQGWKDLSVLATDEVIPDTPPVTIPVSQQWFPLPLWENLPFGQAVQVGNDNGVGKAYNVWSSVTSVSGPILLEELPWYYTDSIVYDDSTIFSTYWNSVFVKKYNSSLDDGSQTSPFVSSTTYTISWVTAWDNLNKFCKSSDWTIFIFYKKTYFEVTTHVYCRRVFYDGTTLTFSSEYDFNAWTPIWWSPESFTVWPWPAGSVYLYYCYKVTTVWYLGCSAISYNWSAVVASSPVSFTLTPFYNSPAFYANFSYASTWYYDSVNWYHWCLFSYADVVGNASTPLVYFVSMTGGAFTPSSAFSSSVTSLWFKKDNNTYWSVVCIGFDPDSLVYFFCSRYSPSFIYYTRLSSSWFWFSTVSSPYNVWANNYCFYDTYNKKSYFSWYHNFITQKIAQITFSASVFFSLLYFITVHTYNYNNANYTFLFTPYWFILNWFWYSGSSGEWSIRTSYRYFVLDSLSAVVGLLSQWWQAGDIRYIFPTGSILEWFTGKVSWSIWYIQSNWTISWIITQYPYWRFISSTKFLVERMF